jgi:hypothetical protein
VAALPVGQLEEVDEAVGHAGVVLAHLTGHRLLRGAGDEADQLGQRAGQKGAGHPYRNRPNGRGEGRAGRGAEPETGLQKRGDEPHASHGPHRYRGP